MFCELDYIQPLVGQWVRFVWSSLYGPGHLRHVSDPLPYSEGQRSLQVIQQPFSSDCEGFPHEGLDVGPPSPVAASHFHAHHSGKYREESLSCVYMSLVCLAWTHTYSIYYTVWLSADCSVSALQFFRRGLGDFFIACLFTTEFSTPFISIGKILIQVNH